jgi:primosomal protein N' (replication factor Y)
VERIPGFVEVWVPVAMPKPLTYSLDGVDEPVLPGMRVVVRVGLRKRHTGVVAAVFSTVPAGVPPGSVRPIDAVVDDRPVVSAGGLALQRWMAEYYLCTAGEVVAAALPLGLKLAGETRVMRHPEPPAEGEPGDVAARDLLYALEVRGPLSVDEVGAVLQTKNPMRVVNRLVAAGWVMAEDELRERFAPRRERWIRVAPKWAEAEEALGREWEALEARAPAQARLLLAVLAGAEPVGTWMQEGPVVKGSGVAGPAVAERLAERGLVERWEGPAGEGPGAEQAGRDGGGTAGAPAPLRAPLPTLSPAQTEAYRACASALAAAQPVLLHGVTGSGKTEVYIHLIADALERGQQVLFLVPEIALTTQLIGRLQAHFSAYLSVYHSRFTPRERTETWYDVLQWERRSRGRLIVGPRSALFLPFERLGLILVDEEHDASYKQQDPAPRYQARDAALWLSHRVGAGCVLGSATPSVESVWLAQEGKLVRVPLLERFGGAQLPEIVLSDLLRERRRRSMKGHFTPLLREAMEEALSAGRQIILFLNRRGYAPVWQCGTCGHAPLCERCDVPMTHHKAKGELQCHHCGYRVTAEVHCTACGRPDNGPRGLGTERVEEELAEFFPRARVARMDADTTRSRHAHGRLIEAFSRREFDVLIGTQMVTKGLDFAHVGVVGVLNADRMLTFPDFRSFERAYQMLTQVAGRAGRTGRTPSHGVPSNLGGAPSHSGTPNLGGAAAPVPGGAAAPNLNLNPVPGAAAPNLNLNPVPSGAAAPSPGTVIIQTSTPDHWVLNRVVAGDYDGLVQQELFERAAYGYPPFHRLIRITLKHSDLNRLERGAAVLATRLRDRFAARCIGPETPAIGRIDDLHIRVILLKFERAAPPARYKAVLREDLREFHADPHWKRLRLTVDVDPA